MILKALNNVFYEVFKGNLDYILPILYAIIIFYVLFWVISNEYKQRKEMQKAKEFYRMKLKYEKLLAGKELNKSGGGKNG